MVYDHTRETRFLDLYFKEVLELGTDIRPEVSEKNKYWISRHRYYELKHFCLQYSEWVEECRTLSDIYGVRSADFEREKLSKTNVVPDPVFECASRRELLGHKIDLVRRLAIEVGGDLHSYILLGVTEGWTYSKLRASMTIPCCKDTYYELYRKFFWLLDKTRN